MDSAVFIDLRDRFTSYMNLEQIRYFNESLKKRDEKLKKEKGPEALIVGIDSWLKSIKAMEIYQLLKTLGINFSGDILELGAGHGWLTSLLSREPSVKKIFSVDCAEYLVKESSQRMYDYLKADRQKIINVLGDFHNLDYWETESIDSVFLDAAFHHTNHPDIVLREVMRVLKKKGFCLALRENFIPLFRPDLVRKHYREARKTQTIERLHYKSGIRRLAKDMGCSFRHHLLYFPQGVLGQFKKLVLAIVNGYFMTWNCVFIFRKI